MARRLATEMARHHVERRFGVMNGSVAAFRTCLTSSGGMCTKPTGLARGTMSAFAAPTAQQPLTTDLSSVSRSAALTTAGPSAAVRMLSHPVQQRLNGLYNQLSGLGGGDAGVRGLQVRPRDDQRGDHIELRFSAAEIDEYVALAAEATEGDDWNRLSRATPGALAPWDGTLLAYISAYVKAYFRGGRFLKLSGPDLTELQNALKERFPYVPATDLRKMFPAFFGSSGLFGAVGSDAFVTRAGAAYQFPAIEARVDPIAGHVTRGTEVELPVVAADLTRVVLEAVFDAHDRLPAVSSATGATIEPSAVRLPVHDPTTGAVDVEEFAEVNRIANQAEAAVSSVVAPAIRGAGWGSLNNEALAKLIETLVSVTVRKVTEKAAWCWYACGSTTTDAFTATPAAPIELTLVIDS